MTCRPFVFRRRIFARAEPSEDYMQRLEELAAILHGLPWMLAGGLAIPVTIGRFYRGHADVDIAFPLEDFGRVETAMKEAGYYLATYFPVSLFGRCRRDLHVRTRAFTRLARWHPRRLRFLDAASTAAPSLRTVVDVFPFRVSDGVLSTYDRRHLIRLDRPLVGHRFKTVLGHDIPCLDLQYVAMLKRGSTSPKDRLDLSVIDRQG